MNLTSPFRKEPTLTQVKAARMRPVLFILLLLIPVTFFFVGYRIGNTEQAGGYRGRIIDTIFINSAQAERTSALNENNENNDGTNIPVSSKAGSNPVNTGGTGTPSTSAAVPSPEVSAKPTDPQNSAESDRDPHGGGVLPETTAPKIDVRSDTGPFYEWTQSTPVDIFAERTGTTGVQTVDGKTVLTPGAAGKFVFNIKNTESFSVLYSVSLVETDLNVPELPMKYRLRINNSNAGGDGWKPAEDIKAPSLSLAPGESTVYTLEWKWDAVNDAADTEIGMQMTTPPYVLNILISADAKGL